MSCAISVNVNVGAIEGPVVSDIKTTVASCNASNGTAVIEPSNYQYTWLFDDFVGASRFDLAAGSYDVEVINPCFARLSKFYYRNY